MWNQSITAQGTSHALECDDIKTITHRKNDDLGVTLPVGFAMASAHRVDSPRRAMAGFGDRNQE